MSGVFKKVALLAAASFLLLIAYLAYLQISGNFYVVSSGTVYRAAQMDGQNIAKWRREYGIASILNLRGKADGADWYETERGVASHLGIEHINFGMSEQHELTDTEVTALVEIMRNAPKPMLIHCRAGADRTGIASALYLAAVDGEPETVAEQHLSIRYGHIGLPWISKAWSMDLTWERIEPWLGYGKS